MAKNSLDKKQLAIVIGVVVVVGLLAGVIGANIGGNITANSIKVWSGTVRNDNSDMITFAKGQKIWGANDGTLNFGKTRDGVTKTLVRLDGNGNLNVSGKINSCTGSKVSRLLFQNGETVSKEDTVTSCGKEYKIIGYLYSSTQKDGIVFSINKNSISTPTLYTGDVFSLSDGMLLEVLGFYHFPDNVVGLDFRIYNSPSLLDLGSCYRVTANEPDQYNTVELSCNEDEVLTIINVKCAAKEKEIYRGDSAKIGNLPYTFKYSCADINSGQIVAAPESIKGICCKVVGMNEIVQCSDPSKCSN